MSMGDVEDEMRFAVQCLKDDLRMIYITSGLIVRGVWLKYKRGDLSLPTAVPVNVRATKNPLALHSIFPDER